MAQYKFILSLLLSLAAMQAIHAIQYEVLNKAGNTRFNNDIGVDYSKKALDSVTNFIWHTFQQNSQEERKNIQKVTLIIENMDGVASATNKVQKVPQIIEDADDVALEINNEIHVSASYIAGYSGDVRKDFTGVLYHEMTHIWQWNGSGQTPEGLIEGIADYVRLKAGYARSDWVQPGHGDRWDQGHDVTARFLDHCNGLKQGFVAELNKKMRNGYSNNYFLELLGNNVDQLWSEYKARYGN